MTFLRPDRSTGSPGTHMTMTARVESLGRWRKEGLGYTRKPMSLICFYFLPFVVIGTQKGQLGCSNTFGCAHQGPHSSVGLFEHFQAAVLAGILNCRARSACGLQCLDASGCGVPRTVHTCLQYHVPHNRLVRVFFSAYRQHLGLYYIYSFTNMLNG